MKHILTIQMLVREAMHFAREESLVKNEALYKVTDGKKIGTYIERRFKDFLRRRFSFRLGNCSQGIDFPDNHINTDIKVTLKSNPQSSCPYKNYRQKIFGLGFNILLFTYQKDDVDDGQYSILMIDGATLIPSQDTADFHATRTINKLLQDGVSKEGLLYFLESLNLPCDGEDLNELVEEIIIDPPPIGKLTISNALQWRLQYGRVIKTA